MANAMNTTWVSVRLTTEKKDIPLMVQWQFPIFFHFPPHAHLAHNVTKVKGIKGLSSGVFYDNIMPSFLEVSIWLANTLFEILQLNSLSLLPPSFPFPSSIPAWTIHCLWQKCNRHWQYGSIDLQSSYGWYYHLFHPAHWHLLPLSNRLVWGWRV